MQKRVQGCTLPLPDRLPWVKIPQLPVKSKKNVFRCFDGVKLPAYQNCVWKKGGEWPCAQGTVGGGFQKQVFALENAPENFIRGLLNWKHG